ncbi:MAG: glycosyltransferase [Thermoplasmatota archaeon]
MRSHEETKVNVSVVVPVGGDHNNIERCLTAIMDQSFKDHEILVIDGSSSDPVEKIIRKFQKRCKRLKLSSGDFFSISELRNRGIMESRADIILMTNPDCEAPRDWIERIIEPLLSGEDIVQGGTMTSSRRSWSYLHQLGKERLKKKSSKSDNIGYLDMRNIAFRKSALIEIGMFDRNVRNLEGLDIKLRARRYGLKIRYLPDSVVSQYVDLDLRDLFLKWVELGKWIYFIYSMNKPGTKKSDDRLFNTLSLKSFILFVPGILLVFFRYGLSHFLSEIICGTALRTGIIVGIFGKEKFLRSIQTKYY